MKPVALTRKNALFSDSVDGAIATATVFSIINTAAANHLDPYKYLEYLFRQLPNLGFKPEGPALDEYLPWSDKMQLEFKVQHSEDNEEGKPQSETA